MSTVIRAEFELQQNWNTNFVFATLNNLLNAPKNEQLTEKPPIILEDNLIHNPPTQTDNCLIVITGSQEGNSIELGEDRHVVWFIDGYISYESRIDKTDEMLYALKAYLTTLMNTNNINTSRNWRWGFDTTLPNSLLMAGKLAYVVKATRTDVSAIA